MVSRGALKIAIVALSIGLQTAVWSQEDPLRFKARIHTGFAASQIHGDGISGFNKFGASVGASVAFGRAANTAYQWGILYTQKGSRRVPDPKNGDYTTWRYRFTYIDLPLLKIWSPSPDVWWWGVGIQPSILVKAEEDFYGNGYRDLTTPDINTIDWGGVLNAGFQFRERVALDVRLTQSLLPISDRPPGIVAQWDNFMMNMAIQWMVTWQLG